MKQAILCFCLGEFFWEIGRFAPHVIYLKTKKYKDVDFIILTKPENFDIYGKHASILVPFRLKESEKYRPDCFKLHGISDKEYLDIIKELQNQYSKRYKIIKTVYPNITGKKYVDKNQYSNQEKIYDYRPRGENLILLEKYLTNKPLVILAPRFRVGTKLEKRNWKHWNKLYDLIYKDKKLLNKFSFVICGKSPDYVPDYENRFLDINKIEQNINTSLVGLTIESIKKGVLTIGSQSAIPNISLLLGTEVLEWGHQKHLHSINYNVKRTKVTFLEDMNYDIKPEIIYEKMVEILKRR